MSQQAADDSDVADLAKAVGAARTRRSSRLQATTTPADPAPSSSSKAEPSNPGRWDTAKEVKIVTNSNTEKADKKAVKAFTAFLQERHNLHVDLSKDAATMDQARLKELLADYITRVSIPAQHTAQHTQLALRMHATSLSMCNAITARPGRGPAQSVLQVHDAGPASGQHRQHTLHAAMTHY